MLNWGGKRCYSKGDEREEKDGEHKGEGGFRGF